MFLESAKFPAWHFSPSRGLASSSFSSLIFSWPLILFLETLGRPCSSLRLCHLTTLLFLFLLPGPFSRPSVTSHLSIFNKRWRTTRVICNKGSISQATRGSMVYSRPKSPGRAGGKERWACSGVHWECRRLSRAQAGPSRPCLWGCRQEAGLLHQRDARSPGPGAREAEGGRLVGTKPSSPQGRATFLRPQVGPRWPCTDGRLDTNMAEAPLPPSRPHISVSWGLP